MKVIIMIALWLGLTVTTVHACDVCGCAVGGNYFGILPQFHRNFIGLRYQYRSFYSEHVPLFGETDLPHSNEYYHSTELWGRWNPARNLQIFAFVPYHIFHKNEEGVITNLTGLGDVSLIANFVLLNTGDSTQRDWKHALQIGGGVKLPTGHHTTQLADGDVNPNFQAGTGAFDFPLNAIYTVRYKRAGMSAEVDYRINTANADDYRFGNRMGSSLRFFYWQQLRRNAFLPSVGVLWEHADADTEKGIQQDFTGGESTWASAGVDAYFSRLSVGVLYQQPIQQNLGEGHITAHPRVSASVSFLF